MVDLIRKMGSMGSMRGMGIIEAADSVDPIISVLSVLPLLHIIPLCVGFGMPGISNKGKNPNFRSAGVFLVLDVP